MKLVRHFLAVLLVVGLVIGLAFLWKGSPAASVVADDHDRFRPSGGTDQPVDERFDRRHERDNDVLSRFEDLGQSVFLVGLIIGGVVLVDRRRQRNRRQVIGSPPGAAPG